MVRPARETTRRSDGDICVYFLVERKRESKGEKKNLPAATEETSGIFLLGREYNKERSIKRLPRSLRG